MGRSLECILTPGQARLARYLKQQRRMPQYKTFCRLAKTWKGCGDFGEKHYLKCLISTHRMRTNTMSNPRSGRINQGWRMNAEEENNMIPPAFAFTLDVLEWSRLCRFVASFAQTALGQRKCSMLIPETNIAKSQSLLDETRAVDVLQSDYATELEFGGIETALADEALQRAKRGGMLSGTSLIAVNSLLKGAIKLKKTISRVAKEADAVGHTDIQSIVEIVTTLPESPDLASEIAFSLQDDGNVRESASDDVRRAANKVRTIEGRLSGILKGGKGEVIEHKGRLCLSIPAASGVDLPSGVMLGSGPGGTVQFIEPKAAIPLNNERTSAKNELLAAEETVLWRLTRSVSAVEVELTTILNTIVWLDIAAAKSKYGRWIEGTLPELLDFSRVRSAGRNKRKFHENSKSPVSNEEKSDQVVSDALDRPNSQYLINLRRVRHPLLLGDYLLSAAEHMRRGSRAQNSSNFDKEERRLPGWRKNEQGSLEVEQAADPLHAAPVPFDILVESGKKAVIITGPNTGGKTATLKALGLIVLAAKSGIPVPVEAPAIIPAFDVVLADIGDEQSLSANLSTFSGHLKRIEALREESTGNSLVLLDEMGTGTDPEEGAALGIALLRKMVQGGRGGAGLIMATTHHSALTTLKYDNGNDYALLKTGHALQQDEFGGSRKEKEYDASVYENASVEFDETKLMPTYRLLWGVPGRSNALNIAEKLGMEKEIVESARARLGTAAKRVDETIVALEDTRRTIDDDEAAILKTESKIQQMKLEYQATRSELAALQSELQHMKSKALSRAFQSARSKIRNIKKLGDERSNVLGEKKSRENPQRDTLQSKHRCESNWVPTKGSTVYVPQLGSVAKVVSVKNNGQNLVLQVGLMKMTVGIDEIREN